MQTKVSTPVVVVVLVVVVAVAALVVWKVLAPGSSAQQGKTAGGVPLTTPVGSRADAEKMHQMFQGGAMRPPTSPPTGAGPNLPPQPGR